MIYWEHVTLSVRRMKLVENKEGHKILEQGICMVWVDFLKYLKGILNTLEKSSKKITT